MKILITGASGFTGRSMVRFLASLATVDIAGLARKDSPDLIHAPRISWFFADLLDARALSAAVSAADPDAIMHLAGLTRGSPEELHAANVEGTRNLLESVIRSNPACPVVVVSSSAVYGYAGTAPIPETAELRPVSGYGTSKAGQETLCRRYGETMGCRIAVARPFNLVGPGQLPEFVCGRIVTQVTEIETGGRDAIDLLETGSFRDFIDVRDVVRGYWSLVSHPDFDNACAGNTFNLGSGNPCSIADIIWMLETITGEEYPVRLSEGPIPVPVPYQRSDNYRITRVTGWNPSISLPESLRDMLDVARSKIRHD